MMNMVAMYGPSMTQNRQVNRMVEKKLVDSIGSVDDFGVTGGYEPTSLGDEPSKQTPMREEDGISVIWEKSGESISGENRNSITSSEPYIVESRDTVKGVIRTVYPLLPFCKWCSPAARRENDNEWTSGWNEEGAEVRMSQRESRLSGVPHSDYYSFTLTEQQGDIICENCGQSPAKGEEVAIPVKVIRNLKKKTPVEYDVEAVQLGIKCKGEIIRIPERLVANWVSRGQLQQGVLAIGHEDSNYTLTASDLLKEAIWDETNKEWLLSTTKCTRMKVLRAELIEDTLTVPVEILIGWRQTALSVDSIVAASHAGLTYTTSLSEYLAGGKEEGSMWEYETANCSGPYFMDMEMLNREIEPQAPVLPEKPRSKQTDILDY